jgi:hypothetical protein
MAILRELVKQRRDAIPGRVRVEVRVLRCQSIKYPYTGAGAWTTCVQVPSSEAVLAEWALSPRARRGLLVGASRTPPEGSSVVLPRRAAGATGVVIVSCVCFQFVG